jgi:hypothetical protein
VSRGKPNVGDVIQLTLPSGRYAYGRVLRDASVAFYSETTPEPGAPPVGSRSYQFVVGVYEDVLTSACRLTCSVLPCLEGGFPLGGFPDVVAGCGVAVL